MSHLLARRTALLAAAALICVCLAAPGADAADFTPFDATNVLVPGATMELETGCTAELNCTYPYVPPPSSVSCTGTTTCTVGAGYVVCDGAYTYCTCPTMRCANWYSCWKRYGDEAACVNGCCDLLI